MAKPDYDDDLPVLNEVVESGNESIIQSSRLGREVLRELEVLQRNTSEPFTIDADHAIDLVADTAPTEDDGEYIDLEQLVDNLVDKHITELRKDITQLLECVKKRP